MPFPRTEFLAPMRPHTTRATGECLIEVSGQILNVHMHGHWNEKKRDDVAHEILRVVPALQARGAWGIINCLHDTVIFTPAFYEQTQQSYRSRPLQSRLCAVAFVLDPNAEGAGLMRSRFEDLLQDIIPSQVFDNMADAHAWMQGQLQSA